MEIPQTSAGSYEKGDEGFGVWAIQRALNALGRNLDEDGVFGRRTQNAVVTFQGNIDIGADGVVGQRTTQEICTRLISHVAGDLPDRLLEAFCMFEGGFDFGAVNRSVAGGVDCGIVQRRVFEGDYDREDVKQRAFDAGYQLALMADHLASLHDHFVRDYKRQTERAWRLAALDHNYPAGAEQIGKVGPRGLTEYWWTPQTWVPRVYFDDGHPVQSPYEWCQFYALGSSEHNELGLVTALTTKWP